MIHRPHQNHIHDLMFFRVAKKKLRSTLRFFFTSIMRVLQLIKTQSTSMCTKIFLISHIKIIL